MIQKFEFRETAINGLIAISPFNADDNRGCFTKDYSKEIFQENGIAYAIAEIFYTQSHRGVIRGLHFQREKQQAKFVRCLAGHIYDVVVDLRKDSSTFKQYLGFDLTGKNRTEIIVPEGCAHGYIVLEEAIVSYKCSEKFYSEFDDGIIWSDPDIAVDWHLERIGGIDNIILAEKDMHLQSFQNFMQKYGGF